ncbi:MAG: hypothetical protein ACPG5T_08835 [Endozoicomonas sp.]
MIGYANVQGIKKVGFSKPLKPDAEKIKVFLMSDDAVFIYDLNVVIGSVFSSQIGLLHAAIKIMNKMIGNSVVIERSLENGVSQ